MSSDEASKHEEDIDDSVVSEIQETAASGTQSGEEPITDSLEEVIDEPVVEPVKCVLDEVQ